MTVSCPYQKCDHKIEPENAGSVSSCHGCGGIIYFCASCGIPNHFWAAFCRACGCETKDRRAMVERDPAALLSRGLHLQRPETELEVLLENAPRPGWHGKLVSVEGSALIFGGIAGNGYNEAFLVHPHLGPAVIELHRHFTELQNTKLSGDAVMSDRHLFLGSADKLYRFDLSAISTSLPYQPHQHLTSFKAASDRIVFLSQRLFLLWGLKDQCFSLWDTGSERIVARTEVEARFFAVSGDWLFAARNSGIEVFRIDHEKQEIEKLAYLSGPGGNPAAAPVFAERRLFVLFSTISGESGRVLYKWELQNGAGFSDPRRVSADPPDGMIALGDKYALLRSGGAYVCDPVSDTVQVPILMQWALDLETPPASFGPFLALPIRNGPASKSIWVVNGISGGHHFATGPFHRFLAAPVLWGPRRFVLGRLNEEAPAGLYIFDFMGHLG
ncbi:hypothetical protein SBDP2_330008 [Syntrophobacter sp. SbD2]|nr:hypothetical protein SBDP2_330008 [Syntrophobacter sp. SbD2]